jgi:hypothetical protein
VYRIKTKENLNLLIQDIGVTLKADTDTWRYINEDVLDNSTDFKNIKHLVNIEQIDSRKEEDIPTNDEENEDVTEVNEGAYVIDGDSPKNPDDAFVANPNEEGNPVTDDTIEENDETDNIDNKETDKDTTKEENNDSEEN